MSQSKRLLFGLVAAIALTLSLNAATAGDEAPAKAKEAPSTPAKAVEKTPTPIHSMMKWVSKQITRGASAECCPSTEKGEAVWRAWFAKKRVPLAKLRDAMVADGWTADKTVAFFKARAAKMSCAEGCESTKDGGCPSGGCPSGGCPKSKDAEDGDCPSGGCPKDARGK